MKKIIENMSCKKICKAISVIFIALVGLAIMYGFVFQPMQVQANRAACHASTIAEAQKFGEQVIEQNKENKDLTQEEVTQQVNALITQRYELNYQLCLRSYGL